MLLTAIFFVSVATLAFEVLLTRVFAIGQWNHLSFMVLSIALFGFGASGTVLSMVTMSRVQQRWQLASQPSIAVLLCLFSTTDVLSFLFLNHMPLDYFRLPVEPLQSLYLLSAYTVLSLPFFFSGLIISIGYTTIPRGTGLVYFATMAGSALGALSPIIILPFIEEGSLILLSAAFALIPATISGLKSIIENRADTPRQRSLNAGVLICSLGMFAFTFLALTSTLDPIIRIRPSPYKALGQILQFPETRITESTSGIRARIDQVKTPYIRFAPGLSLKYTRTLPGQHAIYRDGDDPLVLYDLFKNNDADFAKYMLSFIGYTQIIAPDNILLVQQGGGTAVPCALASRAVHIAIIEQNQTVAQKLRQQYKLRVINQNPRAFFSQNKDRYAIIHIENWGASIPGAAALNQDHTFTIDAVSGYWNHLTANGVVIISRKLLLPPSDSLRLWGTAYEALQKAGVHQPLAHLALLRNFDTYTLLVSKSPVNVKRITDFAQQRNFDLIFHKDIRPEMVNKFHVFEKPYHFREIMRLSAAYESGRHNDFFRKYLLDVRPQSDRRPFPGRFLKWTKVKLLYESLGSRFYALFMSGEIVISLVFIEALILALVLLVLPVVLLTRKIKKPTFFQASYFFGIGAGFMFVELYFIKFFILIFGDPTISFTLVVSAVLISSSLGGLYMHSRSVRSIFPALFTLIGGLILVSAGLEVMTDYLLNISIGWRVLVALLLILPVGLLMGLPFPLGMRYLLDNPVQRAYAWSVNGCASVLSSIAAAQLAISVGIPAIVLGAVVGYLVAVGAIKKG
jgi:hypothetical protein